MTPLEAVGISRDVLDITDVMTACLDLGVEYMIQNVDGDDCVVMDSGDNDNLIITAFVTSDKQLTIVAINSHNRELKTPCFPVFREHIVKSIQYIRNLGRVPSSQELGVAIIYDDLTGVR